MSHKRKSPNHAQRKAAALSFFLFFTIAAATVVLLEYLDYRAGKYSLIFTKIFPLGQPVAAGVNFSREWNETLKERKVTYDFFKDREGLFHYKIEVFDPLYKSLTMDLRQLVEKNRGSSQLSEVQGMKEQIIYLYQLRFNQRLTHIILLTRHLEKIAVAAKTEIAEIKIPKTPEIKIPRLALVIDDIGYTDHMAEQLRVLGIPITAAIIPSAPYARSESEKIHAYGLEEIIHLPMQSKDPGNHHPRDEFVLMDSSQSEIAALIEYSREKIPHARGLNNHMGSLITSNPDMMRMVLEQVKKAGLFFIDSKTTLETSGYRLAREMKIKTALRDIFLDDQQNYAHSSGQIKRLAELAIKNGRALAIGHPFPSTFAAIRDAIPWLKTQKVAIVFAFELLE